MHRSACPALVFVLMAALASAAPDMSLRIFSLPNGMDMLPGRGADRSRGEFIEMGAAATSVNPRTNLDAKKYFADLGVGFPEGSYIHYRNELGGLLMFNTEVNHRRLGRLMTLMGQVPSQVEIDFSFVAFTTDQITDAARRQVAAAPTSEQLKALWMAGQGRLAASAKVLTRSGVNSQVKGVQEVIYPTEFEATSFQGTQAARSAKELGAITLPGSFETREVGIIANVTPTVGPDGHTIDLTMVPELCSLEGWDTHVTPLVAPGSAPSTTAIQQPSFHDQSATTSMVMDDGSTLILGGMPNRAGTEWLYVFTTARLLDFHGSATGQYAGYPLDDEPAKPSRRAP